MGFQALQGPKTGDIYHIGRLLSVNPDTVSLIRFSDPDTITWTRYINMKLSYRSFCIDPNETFIYSIEFSTSTTYTLIHGFHTNDGSIGMSKRI